MFPFLTLTNGYIFNNDVQLYILVSVVLLGATPRIFVAPSLNWNPF